MYYKVVEDIRQIGKEIREFAQGVLLSWQAYITGGIVAAFASLYEHKTQHSISWESYRWGVITFALVACFIVWRREKQSADELEKVLEPKFDLLHRHDLRAIRLISAETDRPVHEYHRVVINNVGRLPVDDVRVYVQRLLGRQDTIELEPYGVTAPVRLFHDNPIAFDLFQYDYKTVRLCGRGQVPTFSFEPFELMIAVVGSGAPTLRRKLSVDKLDDSESLFVAIHLPLAPLSSDWDFV